MAAGFRLFVSAVLGVSATLISTFVGERWATAAYPEIMGCESGCRVVATGWPLVLVRDYPGMSVVNTADVVEVWIGGDRLAWSPLCVNVLFWGGLCWIGLQAVRWSRRPPGGRSVTTRDPREASAA